MIDENSMTPYKNKVRRNLLTNVGRRIFLEAADGLGTIVYTRATLSSQKLVDINGNEFDNNTVREINNLADDLKEGQIKLGTIADDHFDVIADFNNENQFSDVSFNTVGWYARLDTVGSDGGTTEGKEVLMVITEMTDQPTTLPACSADGLSTQSISIELDMAISNAADIKMTAERNDYVTHTELNVWKTKIIADIKAVSLDPNIDQIKKNTTHIQEVQGAGKFVQVYLTDQNGTYITDQNGAHIVGNKWLPAVDKTLTQSDLPADAKAVGDAIQVATTFKPEKYNIPVLYLWGDNILSLKDKSKTLKNEVTYKFPRYHVQGTIKKFKVQGSSSVGLPKKNYTLNLDQDCVIFPSYGKQHKYVIKANYADASQALNVVNAKLWGHIRATHCQASDALQDNQGNYLVDSSGNHILAETDPQLSVGGNFGAVDGFPVAVYINDKYWGLYSFNIPKDNWMAKMPSKAGYGIADAIWTPQGAFKATTNFKDQMELQFCGTKDTKWMQDSLNTLISACIADYNKPEDFDKAVGPLIDFDSVYDYYIYSVLTGNVDGVYRNYLLQTFNGKKWYFAAYDMDETFGRSPQSVNFLSAESTGGNDFWHEETTFENMAANSRLFYQFWKFHKSEVLSRTKNLIEKIMSVSNVDTAFVNYNRNIPQPVLAAEYEIWSQMPDTSVNTVDRISRWYIERMTWLKHTYFSDDSRLNQLEAKVENLLNARVAGN